MQPLADQSLFVRASIDGVIREATIAACLTGLDDPDLSGQLAQHPDYCSFDPALDSDFDYCSERARAKPSTS